MRTKFISMVIARFRILLRVGFVFLVSLGGVLWKWTWRWRWTWRLFIHGREVAQRRGVSGRAIDLQIGDFEEFSGRQGAADGSVVRGAFLTRREVRTPGREYVNRAPDMALNRRFKPIG